MDYGRLRETELNKPLSQFVERNKAEGRELSVDNNQDVSDFYDDNDRFIITNKELKSISIDPSWLTADVDVENNHYPRRIIPSRIEAYKSKKRDGKVYRDIMQDIKTELKKDEDKKDKPVTEDKK